MCHLRPVTLVLDGGSGIDRGPFSAAGLGGAGHTADAILTCDRGWHLCGWQPWLCNPVVADAAALTGPRTRARS